VQWFRPVHRIQRQDTGPLQNAERVDIDRERIPAETVQQNAASGLPGNPRQVDQGAFCLLIRQFLKEIQGQRTCRLPDLTKEPLYDPGLLVV
jgi:hypothetical protein